MSMESKMCNFTSITMCVVCVLLYCESRGYSHGCVEDTRPPGSRVLLDFVGTRLSTTPLRERDRAQIYGSEDPGGLSALAKVAQSPVR